jgi:hypothetical protein
MTRLLRHRHRRRPPVQRIMIPDSDPVIEVVGLLAMVERLDEIIRALAAQIRDLRSQLAVYPVEPPPSILETSRPIPIPKHSTDAASLHRAFDQLHDLADALWFECQWLRAELAAAQEASAAEPPPLTT